MRKSIKDWALETVPSDEMLWKGSWGRQVLFLRDQLRGLISAGLEYEDGQEVDNVISTHRSKSIVLPVVEYTRKDLGLRLIVRDNFYNWKLSVISEKPIDADFTGLFYESPPREPEYTGNCLSAVYFEGFPESLVFGYLATSDRRKWSAEIYSDRSLWTVVFLIMRSLGAIKPMVQRTQAEHRAELDADRDRRKASEAARSQSEGDPR